MSIEEVAAAFRRAPVLLAVLDESGRIVRQNDPFSAAFADATGAEFETVFAVASPGLCSFVRRLIARGAEFRIDDLLLRTPQAGELRVEAHGLLLGPQRFLAALVDQTERVTAATARAQRERVDTLARFAGGLSHDLNNMLSVIVTTAQAAVQDASEGVGDPVRDFRAIIDSAQRGAALARSLRAIAFDETGSWRPVDIADEIRAVAAVLGRGSAAVPILLELDPDAPEVVGDRARLHQLVLNLLVNARDATRDRSGGIEVELARSPGGGLRFVVADSGPGVPVELREQIFQPYFSTKQSRDGETWGTGLGLAIVDAVARSTGATVRVDCSRMGGASFSIEWPAMSVVPSQPESVRPASIPVVPAGVLLAEREPTLLDAVARQLRKHGHTVFGALCAAECRRLIEQCGDAIDVAVIDVSLPDGDGRGLAEQLQGLRAGLGVVLTTAGGTRTVTNVALRAEILAKPFDTRDLLACVERARRSHAR